MRSRFRLNQLTCLFFFSFLFLLSSFISFFFFFFCVWGSLALFPRCFTSPLLWLSHASSVREGDSGTKVYLGALVCVWGEFQQENVS